MVADVLSPFQIQAAIICTYRDLSLSQCRQPLCTISWTEYSICIWMFSDKLIAPDHMNLFIKTQTMLLTDVIFKMYTFLALSYIVKSYVIESCKYSYLFGTIDWKQNQTSGFFITSGSTVNDNLYYLLNYIWWTLILPRALTSMVIVKTFLVIKLKPSVKLILR